MLTQEQENINNLIEFVQPLIRDFDAKKLNYACEFCVKSHGTQLRASGEPYYLHPFAVAKIVAEMRLDQGAVITALLHDTIEDTIITFDDIKEQFGENIAKLVDGVTKLTKIESQSENARQADNLRKLLLAMSEDIRVLLVKLADRVHNMRTLSFVKSPEKRKKVAIETLEIFAPLAERIGVHKIKTELQDLAFKELYPDVRNSIIGRLNFLKKSDKPLSDKIVNYLSELLMSNNISESIITGREKTPCSIWLKMQKKNVNFEQLSDIMAFRIIVEDIPSCYQVLGVIHTNYQMIPGEFEDYISTPKDNGYQSIHTIIIGPTAHKIEIQIRTKQMHEVAELGVAAHWLYKQNSELRKEGKQFRWIRELINILQHETTELEDVLENTKMQIYYDQVFCFTPQGQLIGLPKGAVAVDFAYAVHSNIGNTCTGAKINGKIAPLSTILNNGDQVEIITAKNHNPSPSWAKFAITAKAQSEIKRFIKNIQREEYLKLGRAILSKILKSENIEFSDDILEPILPIFKRKSIEELLVSIGEGVINKKELLKALFPGNTTLKKVKDRLSFWTKLRRNKDSNANKVIIRGLIPGMALHYGGCCHPIPGDKIVGIVNTGKGVTVHVSDCELLESYSNVPEKWLDISWEKDINNIDGFIARIKAILINEPGALATLTSTIAQEQANITNLRVVNRSIDFFEFMIDIEVKGATHLSNIITSLRSRHAIHLIERVKK